MCMTRMPHMYYPSFQSLEMANPFTYSDSSNQIKSDVKSISLAGENGTTLVVENATEPFEIILPGMDVVLKGFRCL